MGSPDEDLAAGSPGGRRRGRRRAALAALLVAAGAIAAVLLLDGSRVAGSPRSRRSDGVPVGETTATVTRRTLTESSSVDGTLGYGSSMELYDRLSGTFTWLPATGARIGRGGTLFRVNELPVVLMYGAVPAYRTLEQGVSDGPDVTELNANLADLGYDPYGAIVVDSHFGAATAAAVRRWQQAEGLKQTGAVELGRVIFAPSARRITTVHVTLGQDPPPAVASASEALQPVTGGEPAKSGDPGKAREPAKGHKAKPHGKAPDKSKAKAPASNEPQGSPSKDGEGSPKEGDRSPKEGEGSSKEANGAAAAQAELVLSTTSTQQLVQLKLKAEQQQLAHIGELAPVTLPGGEIVKGRIVAVGTVASEASGGGDEKAEKGSSGEGSGETTIPVTLALSSHVAHLDEAPVSVQLVESVRRDVLAVPATALFATAGNSYAIDVLEAGRTVELAITPGMFANGYVQVEGPGLRAGQTVIEAE